MNLRNIYTDDMRVLRAVHIEAAKPGTSDKSFGAEIEEQIQLILSKFSSNAKGYKVEDGGVLVGYYIVDYRPDGMPYVPVFAVRTAYEGSKQIISEQILQWSAQEYRRQSTN